MKKVHRKLVQPVAPPPEQNKRTELAEFFEAHAGRAGRMPQDKEAAAEKMRREMKNYTKFML